MRVNRVDQHQPASAVDELFRENERVAGAKREYLLVVDHRIGQNLRCSFNSRPLALGDPPQGLDCICEVVIGRGHLVSSFFVHLAVRIVEILATFAVDAHICRWWVAGRGHSFHHGTPDQPADYDHRNAGDRHYLVIDSSDIDRRIAIRRADIDRDVDDFEQLLAARV